MIDRHRKILKAILILSILPSFYFGIKAMFIDLYNPGSLEARELSDMVNNIFWVTIVVAIPLVYEKMKKATAWIDGFNSKSNTEQRKILMDISKPILIQMCIVVVLAIVSAILIVQFFHIPPEVMQNYTDYYSGHSFNYIDFNNISMNQSELPNTPIEYMKSGE